MDVPAALCITNLVLSSCHCLWVMGICPKDLKKIKKSNHRKSILKRLREHSRRLSYCNETWKVLHLCDFAASETESSPPLFAPNISISKGSRWDAIFAYLHLIKSFKWLWHEKHHGWFQGDSALWNNEQNSCYGCFLPYRVIVRIFHLDTTSKVQIHE